MLSSLAKLSIGWACAALVGPPEPTVDSWLPFEDQRVVAESGRYYAVILGNHGKTPLRFELVRRRIGHPRLSAASGQGWLEDHAKTPAEVARAQAELAKVARDPQDPLLAAGTMPQQPLNVELLEQPLGLLLFEKYANVGHGQVLTWCNAEGKVAWSHDLEALFGGRPKGATATVSSLWWYATWGFDAELAKAWVLSRGHEMRLVDLASGKVSIPDEQAVAGIASRASDADCEALLTAAIEAKDVDYRPFVEPFDKLVSNEARPLAIRLRAALVTLRGGGQPKFVVGLFRSSARTAALDEARFAGVHLAEVLGDSTASIPELVSLLCREQVFPAWSFPRGDAVGAGPYDREFRNAGERGLAALSRLANNPDVPVSANLNACILMWRQKQKVFPARLEHLIRHEGESTANAALNATIGSEPEGLHPFLLEMLGAGTHDPVRLAMYFKTHPDRAALAGLKKMLPKFRGEGDEWALETIEAAIIECSRARD